jgi:hypothetical protein
MSSAIACLLPPDRSPSPAGPLDDKQLKSFIVWCETRECMAGGLFGARHLRLDRQGEVERGTMSVIIFGP